MKENSSSPTPFDRYSRDIALLTPKDLARRWGCSSRTLANWRWSGAGPKFVKIGSNVRYRSTDVLEFEAAHYRANTSTMGGPNA
jgi:hypothetical protein